VLRWRQPGLGAAGRSLAHNRSSENGLAADAYYIGSAFGKFLFWVGEESRRLSADRIYFASSEGGWFAAQYALVREMLPDGRRMPPGCHLAVSRRSTYLASFDRVSMENVQPLLAQYHSATVRTVLASLGWIDLAGATAVEQLAAEFDFGTPWKEVGSNVLASPLVGPLLEAHRRTQREALIAYLGQYGLGKGRHKALVVDIGWRGTIQDNLARLLPRLNWLGLYFHLQPFFVRQQDNVTKFSFLLAEKGTSRFQMRRLRFGAPLEFAAGGSSGTVLTYKMEHGTARPVGAAGAGAPADAAIHRLENFRSAVAESTVREALKGDPDRSAALAHTLRYLERPSRATTDLYFSAARDDTFGAGCRRTGSPSFTLWDVAKAAVSAAQRGRLGLALAESQWPWALLRRNVPAVAEILRWIMLATDARLTARTRDHSTSENTVQPL
jgi:hypothetical protein